MDITNYLQPISKNDDSYEEIWVKQKPKYADHIKVWRNSFYTHHGIFVSNNEIIHFASRDGDNLTGSDNEIHKTDLRSFLRGGILEVKVYNSEELAQLNPPNVIVKIARSLVGDDGYNLVFNNCEHFANYCTLGEHRSHQVEKVINPIIRRNSMWPFGNKDKNITTTIYEPDKVRVAEIENKTKLLLKELEAKNIRLKTDMQKEIISHLVEEEKILMQAKIEGYNYLLKGIAEFKDQLLGLRIERRLEIENSHNENNIKTNNYYDEIENKINEEAKDFELNHIPDLLNKLEEYEKDTKSYEIYLSFIEKRTNAHLKKLTDDIKYFRQQRTNQIASSNDLRKILEEHLNEINFRFLELADNKSDLIGLSENEKSLLEQNKNSLIESKEDENKDEEKTYQYRDK